MGVLIGAGHSHLAALRHAKKAWSGDTRFRFVQLQEAGRPAASSGRRDHRSITPEAVNLIREEHKNHPATFVFLSIGGNIPIIHGLVNNDRPFDVYIDSEPDLPVIPGRQIVPSIIVQESYSEKIATLFGNGLDAIRAAVDCPVLLLESPPPIPDEDYIRKNASSFADRIQKRGVSPPLFRYKMWRIYSALVQTKCEAAGVRFIPVPPETQDENRFLRPEGWGQDPAHANAWYGTCVLRQLSGLQADYPAGALTP